MNLEQKSIIEAAEKDGVPACERDARLVVYSMVKATLAAMGKYEVSLKKMTEKQQDAVIGDLESAYKDLSLSIARAMASAGTPSVVMDCKDLKIANGTFTGIVKADQKFFNELISKVQDKSEVVVVLYERQYADALDAIESEKDQRSLPLDGDKPAKKARAGKKADKPEIEIPPKMLDDARDFVTIQQNASIAGLQNLLKIGYEKADAILKALEGEGLVTWAGTEESGQYELVRNKAEPEPELPKFDKATLEVMYSTACREVIKAGSADDSVLRPIYGDDDNLIECALMGMEEDGIVSKPSPEGLRAVLTLP